MRFSEPYSGFCSLKLTNGILQGITGWAFSPCGQSLPPEVLLFFPYAVQQNDLCGIPGQGNPQHVGRIPGLTFVAAAARPVVMHEMPDNRLDLDSPLLGFLEPAPAMMRRPGLAFSGSVMPAVAGVMLFYFRKKKRI